MKKLIIATASTFMLSSLGSAAITQCSAAASQTLAYYATNFNTAANGCQIDDKEFYGFTDTLTAGGSGSTAGVGITIGQITTAYDPGLSFTLSGFSVSSNVSPGSLDLKVGFDVQVLPGGNAIE